MADLSESRGKQELFTLQSPQKLKVLREHALIESAVSSNRIEGVTAKPSRIATLVFGKPLLHDRDEEEIRGYRDALQWIHERAATIPVSIATLKRLHDVSRGKSGDAGHFKKTDNDIIEKYPDGRVRIRFKTVRAKDTASAAKELIEHWNAALEERRVHPLVLMAAFNLDFLCIHPFRDGNGRVSRLLLLLQCYQLGFEAGRYISLERLIEQNKERYYETLEQSSHRWHEGKHDPWPYINFLLYILKSAYKEFEQRAERTSKISGAKTESVMAAIANAHDPFKLADIQRACLDSSLELIRKIAKSLKAERKLECLGRGQSATWRKTKRWKNERIG